MSIFRLNLKVQFYFNSCFLSPEELNLSPQRKDQENLLNTKKCDIFSIGAIILQICTLKNNEYIYSLSHPFINSLSIKNKLEIVKTSYSKDLALIISSMMEENLNLRPELDELLHKIKIIRESKFLEPLFSKTFLRTPQKSTKNQNKCSKSSEKKSTCNLTDMKIIKNFRKPNFSSFFQSNKCNEISKENEGNVSIFKISKPSLSDHKIFRDLSFLQKLRSSSKGSGEKNIKSIHKTKGKLSETCQVNFEAKINFDLPKKFFDSSKKFHLKIREKYFVRKIFLNSSIILF